MGGTETAREGEVCWACCEIKILSGAGRLAYWTRVLLDSQKSMHIRRRTEMMDGCFRFTSDDSPPGPRQTGLESSCRFVLPSGEGPVWSVVTPSLFISVATAQFLFMDVLARKTHGPAGPEPKEPRT
jgi:hypothetical protein